MAFDDILLFEFCRRSGPYGTAHSWRLETQTIASHGRSVSTSATAADRSLSAGTLSRARRCSRTNLVSDATRQLHDTVVSPEVRAYLCWCLTGYVCERKDLLVNGCCNVNAPSSRQYICKSCLASGCCSIYEYCVSCCLQPDKVICQIKQEVWGYHRHHKLLSCWHAACK